MAPADAPFYGEAVVRPEGDMLENFNSTIAKLTGTEDPGALITAGASTASSSEDGLSYAEDIEPWLGAARRRLRHRVDPADRGGRGRRGDRA